MSRRRVVDLIAAVCTPALLCAPTAAEAQTPIAPVDRIDLTALSHPRLVMRFDFDETRSGNYSEIPMFWERHTAAGFPQYLKGGFDREVGHTAPPSFRLDLNAGSVAYHYRAPVIRVKPDSDYQVTAWVRTTRLTHARAWMSAYFLDRSGKPLEGSERVSARFGKPEADTDWQPITLFLIGGNRRATHLGLSIWLAQRSQWHVGPKLPRWIDYQDVHGSAWFDDIEIAPLPHRVLATGMPGNLFTADERVRLRVHVEDSAIHELAAQLEVRGADGRLVLDTPVPIRGKHDAPQPPVELPDLPAGLYVARVQIRARKGVLSDSHLAFAKLAPKQVAPRRHSTQYGIILDTLDAEHFDAYAKLVANLGVGRVKFQMDQELISNDILTISNPVRDAFLRRLTASRQRLIATFTPDPQRGAVGPNGNLTILDVVRTASAAWRPRLSLVLAHFADIAYFWQIAPDGRDAVVWDKRQGKALKRLAGEIARLAPDPNLVAPWSVDVEPPDASADPTVSAEYLSVDVPAWVPPDSIVAHLEPFTARTDRDTWAVMELPPTNRYLRAPRLADVAKRLIFARWAGAHTIFTPPLWHVRKRIGDRVLEPTEDYLVFRTIADVIGRGRAAGKIYLGPTVRCRIFDRGGPATLAIWDDTPPPEGRTVRLYLAPEPTQVDLWGNASAISAERGKHTITLSRIPTFIIGVDAWLQRFRASFAVEPPHLESSIARHEPMIVFSNPSPQPLAGSLVLRGPEGWDIRPNRFRFGLGPGEVFRRKITIQFQRNESAGPKELVGTFALDADRTYQIRVIAPLELGLRDIDVHIVYEITRDSVLIRQTVTNRADRPASFSSFVQVPGRERRERFIYDLPPGRSALKEYVFRGAAALRGRRVRVGLRELRGPRMRNDWIVLR